MNPNQTELRPLHPKITLTHQERLAYIYVRQSTLKQVQHNQESQHYQYRLQERAVELGWSLERIRIVDCDLGFSARVTNGREGFQELVAAVSLGQVGIIFGYEVSRLARNNGDWYHLLDLAALFCTLIADRDGVYDPRLYNDRLLLGLKGTMSEAETHWLRQRLDEGRLNQVKRGAYRQRLPTGYLRLADGSVVKDPDEQVRHILELVFAQFAERGSVNKVVRYLRQQKILLPRRQSAGPQAGQLLWKVASEAAVSDLLQNPAYTGAFAYGRRQADPTRQQPGRPAAGRRRQPQSAWLHLQQDVYPAYLSWEQYVANQERIRQNGLRFVENRQQAQGIVRTGAGLLQGMVICGQCGHHLQTVYKHTPRYVCRGQVRTSVVPSECSSVRAPVVDEVVVQAFFAALQPAQLDALAALLAAQQAERAQLDRHWQEQRQRAHYEVTLAQRQYDAVDPTNRLVAGELERRWEEKLARLQQVEAEYQHFQQTPPPGKIPPHLCDLFRDISQRLPELWPTLANDQKKELLRTLISHVILRRPQPDQIAVRIVWVSGYYSDQTTYTPIHRQQDVTDYDKLVGRIHDLWQAGYTDEESAAQLTQEGFHAARSTHVTTDTVMKIRLRQQWFLPLERLRRGQEFPGFLTIRTLAQRLGVNDSTLYRFIYREIIPPAQVTHEPQTGIYLIRNDPALLTQLQQRILAQKRKNGLLKSALSA